MCVCWLSKLCLFFRAVPLSADFVATPVTIAEGQEPWVLRGGIVGELQVIYLCICHAQVGELLADCLKM